MSAEVTGRCAGQSPASPPAVVLECLGAVSRERFCWGGTARRRRELWAWPGLFPKGKALAAPRGGLCCCSLGRVVLQPRNGSFSILKQLLNLCPVVILGPWECWVKAAVDCVTDTQVLPQHRYLQCLPVLLQVLYFVQPPLCPVPSLGHPGMSWLCLCLSHTSCSHGRWQLTVARDPSRIPCSQKDFASWKLHGAATCWDV